MKKIALVSLLSGLSLYAGSIYATFDVQAQKSANVAFASSGIIKGQLTLLGQTKPLALNFKINKIEKDSLRRSINHFVPISFNIKHKNNW